MLLTSKHGRLSWDMQGLRLIQNRPDQRQILDLHDFMWDNTNDYIGTCTRYPREFKVMVGLRCNMRCKYCIQGNEEEIKLHEDQIDVDAFLERIDKTFRWSQLQTIDLWGGEPLLYWDKIKKILLYFDKVAGKLKRQIAVNIITNGLLWDPEKALWLAAETKYLNYGFAFTHDAQAHKEQRGPDWMDFPKCVKGIKLLEGLGDRFNWAIPSTVTNNHHDLIQIDEYLTSKCKKLGLHCKSIGFNLCRSSDGYAQDMTIVSTLPQFKKDWRYYIDLNKILFFLPKYYHDHHPQSDFFGQYNKHTRQHTVIDTMAFMCGQNRDSHRPYAVVPYLDCGVKDYDSITVNFDGKIQTCQHHYEGLCDIEELKNEYRNAYPFEECKGCEVEYFCRGDCPYLKERDKHSTCTFRKEWHKWAIQEALDILEKSWDKIYNPETNVINFDQDIRLFYMFSPEMMYRPEDKWLSEIKKYWFLIKNSLRKSDK